MKGEAHHALGVHERKSELSFYLIRMSSTFLGETKAQKARILVIKSVKP